jgi:hypothetical protein
LISHISTANSGSKDHNEICVRNYFLNFVENRRLVILLKKLN